MGRLGRLFTPRVGVTGEPVEDCFPRAVHWGPTGWRPLNPSAAPWVQTGRYGDVVLTRRYSAMAGVQLRSRGFNPHTWLAVPGTGLPPEQMTVRPGNLPGGQRFGSAFTPGSLTPWTAAQMRAQLVRAQVAQSGLSSVAFTKALIGANLASA